MTASTPRWTLPGARKDVQSMTRDWTPSRLELIDGVRVVESKHVVGGQGGLVEVFRSDWVPSNALVDQVFQLTLYPGAISAWHAHDRTTDRLFVTAGAVKVVLYDAREGSSTVGRVNELRLAARRPTLLIVPPRVWHGVQNASPECARLLNLVDHAYAYEDPDHWRIAPDSPEVPYRFDRAESPGASRG